MKTEVFSVPIQDTYQESVEGSLDDKDDHNPIHRGNLRIINGMFDKYFFLSECLRYPHYVEVLVCIASNSNYLSDILVINPEFFYLVTDSSILIS